MDDVKERLERFEEVGQMLVEWEQQQGGYCAPCWKALNELMTGSKLGFFWDNIRKDLEEQDWELEVPGLMIRRLFLGTVMSLTPSGKYYTAWANSNVEICDKCLDSGDVPCDHERFKTACRNSTGDGLTGDGHCEACRDAAWKAQFELEADRAGMFVESGEGSATDLFVCQSEEVEY